MNIASLHTYALAYMVKLIIFDGRRCHLAMVCGHAQPGRRRSKVRWFLLGAQPCIGWIRYSGPHTDPVGVISYKDRPYAMTEGRFQDLLQTDASINSDNSGPLIDMPWCGSAQ